MGGYCTWRTSSIAARSLVTTSRHELVVGFLHEDDRSAIPLAAPEIEAAGLKVLQVDLRGKGVAESREALWQASLPASCADACGSAFHASPLRYSCARVPQRGVEPRSAGAS